MKYCFLIQLLLMSLSSFCQDQTITGNLTVTGTIWSSGNKIRFSEDRGLDYDQYQDALFYNGYNSGQVVKLGDPSGNGWFLGKLGIGTNNPTYKFEVRSSSDAPLTYIRQDKNSGGSADVFYLRDDRGYAGENTGTAFKVESWKGAGIANGGTLANFITINDGVATSRLLIDNTTGNIGLGTVAPKTKLDLGELRMDVISSFPAEGSVNEGTWGNYIIGNLNNGQKLRLGVANDNYTRAEIFIDNSNRPDGTISLKTVDGSGGAQTRLFVKGDGKIGIGTVSPSSMLHLLSSSPILQIQSSGSSNAASVNLINDSGAAGLSINSYGSSYSGGTYNRANGVSLHTTSTAGASNGIAIAARHVAGYITFHSGGDTERMRIGANGKVGIGTTTPNVKLEVTGSYGVPSDHGGMLKIIGGTGANTQLQFGVSSNLGYTWMQGTAIGNTNGINMSLNPLGGNVGIGTTSPDTKLAVKGTIHAEEVKVDLSVPWPDYVFEPNYKLLSLEEMKSYIDQHKHLPEVPSAKEMETNGVNVSEMNMLLLKKIEELTLLMIEMKNENNELKQRIENMEKK